MRGADRAKRVIRAIRWRLARGKLESHAPSFRAMFPRGAKIERVAGGFLFTEGPVWFAERAHLLFSDIPGNRIVKLTSNHVVSTFRSPSQNANGLTRDREGRLVACEHGTRRVTRTERDGSITIIAERFAGKRLNSPNDVVVKRDGAVYFTDPPYAITPAQQEQPVQGVFRVSPDGAGISLVVADLEKPNGLAFSPDEGRLYIDNSAGNRSVYVYDVTADGSLRNGRVFCDMNVREPGSPDGMKVDVAGNVFCTGPGGVWVLDDRGTHLGTIVLPEKPSNCAWGGEDWRTLYITARQSVYRICVNTPGIPVPSENLAGN